MAIANWFEKRFEKKARHTTFFEDGKFVKKFERSLLDILEPLAGRKYRTTYGHFFAEYSKGDSFHSKGFPNPRIISGDPKEKKIYFERLTGPNLKQAYPQLDESSRKEIIEEVLRILKKLHNEGCSHGDPKLRNFLFDEDDLYFCDLEHDWNGNPFRRDLLTFTADLFLHNGRDLSFLDIVEKSYKPFCRAELSPLEKIYYQRTYDVPNEFLDFFTKE